jgi:hypothetical protein
MDTGQSLIMEKNHQSVEFQSNPRDTTIKRELQPYNRTRSSASSASAHLKGPRPWSSRILLKEKGTMRGPAAYNTAQAEVITESLSDNQDNELEVTQFADTGYQNEDVPSLEISLKPHSIVLSPRRRDFSSVSIYLTNAAVASPSLLATYTTDTTRSDAAVRCQV